MNILFITHAGCEKPGYFEIWLKNKGHHVFECKPYLGEPLPNVTNFDFLIVMGGPQSPLKREQAPYLENEINLIKECINKNYPIIGICLGAQLIGEAFGAKTEPSPFREIGMYPIELLDAAKTDPIFKHFPSKFNVMHWHNDMPGLIPEAQILAKSEGCPRQIVKYGEKIYGFQCHLELTKDIVQELISHCPNDLPEGKYINSMEALMNNDYSSVNTTLDLILTYFFAFVCSENRSGRGLGEAS